MDTAAIIALFGKGISVISALIQAGEDATPAIQALMKVFGGGKTSVTQAELDQTEAVLDALIDDFDVELPAA